MDEEEVDQLILDEYDEFIWVKVWTIYMGGYYDLPGVQEKDGSHIHLQQVS